MEFTAPSEVARIAVSTVPVGVRSVVLATTTLFGLLDRPGGEAAYTSIVGVAVASEGGEKILLRDLAAVDEEQ